MEQLGWKSDWRLQKWLLDWNKSEDMENKIGTTDMKTDVKDNTDCWYL